MSGMTNVDDQKWDRSSIRKMPIKVLWAVEWLLQATYVVFKGEVYGNGWAHGSRCEGGRWTVLRAST